LAVKVYQSYAGAFKRPDSLTLPKYAVYRNNNGKRQKVDERKEFQKIDHVMTV
jgi:hypothetical protein